MGLVLDTSVVVDLLRGDVRDESILDPAREPVMISTVTLHEILVGLKDGEAELTEAVLGSFALIPVGAAEAALSAHWRREYRSRGLTLELPDTVIAATAAIRNLPLATGNVKDFPMPELLIEPWRGG
ncbi:MAG TPA: PIN domain-containing protein [Solirubrobacterales bacterium]|nr:PIN domain-containing protein [Solirubrobacterales bacterium]